MISLKAQEAVVKADIRGLGIDTVIFEINPLSARKYEDTVIVRSGKFLYKAKVNKPTLAFFHFRSALAFNTPAKKTYVPRSKRGSLVLLPTDTTLLTGVLDKYSLDYNLSGAPVNRELSLQHSENLSTYIQSFKLELKMDSLFKLRRNEEVAPLMEEMRQIKARSRAKTEDFIKQNPDKDYSVLLLVSSNNPEFFGKYMSTLTTRALNGVFKDIFQERKNLYSSYLRGRDIVENTKAPEFSAVDFAGNGFSISNNRGKYVLLDFWGSWCIPCINGFPKMKEYYEKYKARVQFVGVACKDKEATWRSSVKRFNLSWTQLLNQENNAEDVSSLYGVKKFPTKVLIDPDGIIILKEEGESDAFYAKLDSLLNP
jgi:thiol-disulfide isomerase/thioredoxin